MLWVVRAAPFVTLLILGAIVNLARGRPYERLATNIFIFFFAGISCALGLSQHDFWPFSCYPVMVESSSGIPAAVWYEACVAHDSGEQALDSSPITRSVMEKWIERRFMRLHPEEQNAAARFLLQNRCANTRPLGPLTAPDWLVRRAAAVDFTPKRALRIYRHNVSGRVLVYEFRLR